MRGLNGLFLLLVAGVLFLPDSSLARVDRYGRPIPDHLSASRRDRESARQSRSGQQDQIQATSPNDSDGQATSTPATEIESTQASQRVRRPIPGVDRTCELGSVMNGSPQVTLFVEDRSTHRDGRSSRPVRMDLGGGYRAEFRGGDLRVHGPAGFQVSQQTYAFGSGSQIPQPQGEPVNSHTIDFDGISDPAIERVEITVTDRHGNPVASIACHPRGYVGGDRRGSVRSAVDRYARAFNRRCVDFQTITSRGEVFEANGRGGLLRQQYCRCQQDDGGAQTDVAGIGDGTGQTGGRGAAAPIGDGTTGGGGLAALGTVGDGSGSTGGAAAPIGDDTNGSGGLRSSIGDGSGGSGGAAAPIGDGSGSTGGVASIGDGSGGSGGAAAPIGDGSGGSGGAAAPIGDGSGSTGGVASIGDGSGSSGGAAAPIGDGSGSTGGVASGMGRPLDWWRDPALGSQDCPRESSVARSSGAGREARSVDELLTNTPDSTSAPSAPAPINGETARDPIPGM